MHELQRAGVEALLCVAPPAERPAAPDGTVLTELGHDGKARLFILTALGGWRDGRPDLGDPLRRRSLAGASARGGPRGAGGLGGRSERRRRRSRRPGGRPRRRRRARKPLRRRAPARRSAGGHGRGGRGLRALRLRPGGGAGRRAHGCRRARLGPALRRSPAGRGRAHPAAPVALGAARPHGVRLPEHLSRATGSADVGWVFLPVLQPLLRDDRRRRRLRHPAAHPHGRAAVAPQEGRRRTCST